ncbi:MAG: TetR family transcriptional regulator C-terminal domain-containing protein [Gammaproteobacteria bacterium]|nr:TetR family transcriptional regulator C-terminal domain-containing protein [Gammaproteobacteria bacterium]
MARAAPKPRFARQPPEVRRQALIDATIECLKRYGHEGLSIRTISAQAGVSVGLINHHFPNKDELVAAAYRHINSELIAGMQAAVARAGSSPQARMRAFLESWFSAPSLDADALAVWVVFWGLYRHSRLIQRAHRETYQGYVSLLRGMLAELLPSERAARSGRTRRARGGAPAVDLRLAAIGFTALLDGLWLEWCLEPGTFRPAEAVELCEAWLAQLVRRNGARS